MLALYHMWGSTCSKNVRITLAEQALAEVLDDMETALRDQPWLVGGDYTLADIAITPFIERFAVNGLNNLVDWSTRPAVGDWWERVQARPSCAEGRRLDKVPAR